MKALIMAGGTGGHVFPGLAVARVMRARRIDVTWLGTRRGIEARHVPAADPGIRMEWIRIRGVRRTGLVNWLLLPFTLLYAMWQALGVLRRVRPDVVLSFGGFAAGPGGLMAWLMRRPLIIHEQNAIPGLTNRWLSLVARRVLTGFPSAFGAMTASQHVGNPVRAEVRSLPPPAQRFAGRQGPLRVLVVGGSLGARALNDVVPQALLRLPAAERPAVWHQCGRDQQAAVAAAYAGLPAARVAEFIDDMAEAYAWADLVICRAGAMTIAELAAAGLGAILVPYPHAVDDHQTANARYLAEREAATLVPQSELTPERLARLLHDLAGRRDVLLAVAEAARACAVPDAAEAVVETCLTEMDTGGGRHA
jgi:UDP-N-acetylglucosamine--N-acetylmuramyl-(pentapeptide) pyrophosphoryl-undecaprenol N-acetylglucosamine transferase